MCLIHNVGKWFGSCIFYDVFIDCHVNVMFNVKMWFMGDFKFHNFFFIKRIDNGSKKWISPAFPLNCKENKLKQPLINGKYCSKWITRKNCNNNCLARNSWMASLASSEQSQNLCIYRKIAPSIFNYEKWFQMCLLTSTRLNEWNEIWNKI
jgi:hypothetical protein